MIFDVDGTLIDSVHLHAKAWQEAFRQFGHEVPFCQIRSQIGKGGDQLMPVFLSEPEIESKGKEIEKYRGDLFRREFLTKVKPFAKVRELFQKILEDGWKIALASSAKREELEAYKEICHISDLLDAETSSDDSQQSKPHPDIFVAAMKRLANVSPANCIVVGDSPFDAEAATKARVPAVGFLSGGFAETDLRQAGFDVIYWGCPDLYAKYHDSKFHREAPNLSST